MDEREDNERAPKNRTLALSGEERERYSRTLLRLTGPVDAERLVNATINQDLFQVLDNLPAGFVDLLFIDPPYNLTKDFGVASFKEMRPEDYASWVSSWLPRLLPILKPTASVYICKDASGKPKDWDQTQNGDFRLTCPSNLWTDLTVPFWSMQENTDHPTQKPEKLLAKVILASSREGDFMFDPFLGSGTTSVVARKLGRLYCGVEIDAEYS